MLLANCFVEQRSKLHMSNGKPQWAMGIFMGSASVFCRVFLAPVCLVKDRCLLACTITMRVHLGMLDSIFLSDHACI